jgi:hypothetical protein
MRKKTIASLSVAVALLAMPAGAQTWFDQSITGNPALDKTIEQMDRYRGNQGQPKLVDWLDRCLEGRKVSRDEPGGGGYGFGWLDLKNACGQTINVFWGHIGSIEQMRQGVRPGEVIRTVYSTIVAIVCPAGYKLTYRRHIGIPVTGYDDDRDLVCLLTPGY